MVKFVQTKVKLLSANGQIDKGTILPVKEEGWMYRVVRGKYAGITITDYSVELVPEINQMHQELLKYREEVAELKHRVEEWKSNAGQLADENTELRRQLDEAREAKKAQLPQKV
jgi:hypothetical protein